MKKRSLKLLSVAGFIAGLAMIFASCGKDNVPELIVEDPVITVSEADENGRVSVTLSCKTADAQIFYSTDGADPSTEYSAPITLTPGAEEKTYTVKAQAKKSGYTASKVVQKSVTVAAAEEDIATFTVTFESDGGTEVSPVTAEDGTPISEPTAPAKTGYTFAGWYNGETKYDFISNVTSDLTLTAKWTINKYTVTFDTDGGSAIESVTVDYNTAAAQPATNPTKTGYTFAGWKVGETTYDFATLVTADTTVKAVWTINTYTITFDSDGGSAVESITVDYNTTATQPEEPTKDGEYFAGWVDAEGNAFQFTTPITADITLKATWTTDPVYTVTIDPNYEGASTTSIYATKDTEYKVTLSAPSRTGYTFSGWTTDAEGTTAADFTVAISNNTTTFYAQWETASFTVTFDVDGTTTPVTVNYGETIAASDIPSTTKANYTFTGWKNGETAFDVTTATITSNVTLTATWEIYKYTVTLDNDGTTSKLAENVAHGTAVAAPTTTPTKTGYTFAGWKLGDADYNFATPVTADITLTASWNPLTYEITYVLNGGTNADDAVRTYTIETNSITIPTPTKDANKFRGWYETEDFTGTAATTIVKGSTGNKTYYAKWYEFKTYEITLDDSDLEVSFNLDNSNEKYKGDETENTKWVLPEETRVFTGDKIKLTVKAVSNQDIGTLSVQLVDNSEAAGYWKELTNPECDIISTNITANELFTTEEITLEVIADPVGTELRSQKFIFWSDVETTLFGSVAKLEASVPGTDYPKTLSFSTPKVFTADDDEYRIKLTNEVLDDTVQLKKKDTVTINLSGAFDKAVTGMYAMIFDTATDGPWGTLSAWTSIGDFSAKENFNKEIKIAITADAEGTGANSHVIVIGYKAADNTESGAVKLYDSAENIPDEPEAEPIAVLTDWSEGTEVNIFNYADGSVVGDNFIEGSTIIITYEKEPNAEGFKIANYNYTALENGDGINPNDSEGTYRYVLTATDVENCLWKKFVLQGKGFTIKTFVVEKTSSSPEAEPIAVLTDWSEGTEVNIFNYADGSVVGDNFIEGSTIIITYEKEPNAEGFKIANYNYTALENGDGINPNDSEGTYRYVLTTTDVENCLWKKFVLQGKGFTIKTFVVEKTAE